MQLHAGSDQAFHLIAPEGQTMKAVRTMTGASMKLEKDGTIRVKRGDSVSIAFQ
jgi:hypothetical protein